MEIEIPHQSKASGSQNNLTRDKDVEMALGVEPPVGAQCRKPEKAHTGIKLEVPITGLLSDRICRNPRAHGERPRTDLDGETGVEFQDLQYLDRAVQFETEGFSRDHCPIDGVIRAPGVDLQVAARFDFKDREDIKIERYGGLNDNPVGEDPGKNFCIQRDGTQRYSHLSVEDELIV